MGNLVLAEPIKPLDLNKFKHNIPANFNKQTETEIKRGNVLAILNLSDQQKQEMERIRRKYQALILPRRQNLRQAKQDLSNLMVGNSSIEVIRAKHQEVSSLQQQINNLYFESVLEMREILTPSQRTQLAQIIQQYGDKIRNRLGSR